MRKSLLVIVLGLAAVWAVTHRPVPAPPNSAGDVPQAAALSAAPPLPIEGPRHVYLTWQDDPSTTMTVNFQTRGTDVREGDVYYDTVSHAGERGAYRHHALGTADTSLQLADGRFVYHVELTNLRPGTLYYFTSGNDASGFSPERTFLTVPADASPIRFVIGGDMSIGDAPRQLLRIAARADPLFAVVGGDIAYGNGNRGALLRWDAWLDTWREEMRSRQGRMIPMVLAIGNHEVAGGWHQTREKAPFYFGYFAQDERSYFARRFGANMLMLVLDTDHVAEHGGDQAQWIETTLADAGKIPFRFAAYHVPLYPSHRGYDARESAIGRAAWVPLFDRYRLTAAFEHHDHALKRTKLLRGNAVDPDGTLYLGDGCWGVAARTVSATPRWYMERAASVPHFWVVDVAGSGVRYRAIDAAGAVVDRYPPAGAPAPSFMEHE